jgi:hypothetical protein
MTATAPILAAFLSPALFYAGAAAVGVPVLIHLLMRMRFKRVRWAAVAFLMAAEKRNRRRVRMEEWLLLALRCLAVLLIGLLVARPFVHPTGLAAALGGSDRAERIFVIDDSFSMGYRTENGLIFDRAKGSIRRLIETIREESPDDTVTLLRMTDPTNPVEFGTYLDEAQAEQVLARLEALTPSQKAVDAQAAIAGVAQVLERGGAVTTAVVYLVSDFQRRDWVDLGGVAGGPDSAVGDAPAAPDAAPQAGGILAPLVAWAEQDRGLKMFLVHVGEDDAANVAVSDVALAGRRLLAGANASVRARVTNHADQAAPGAEVVVTVGNVSEPAQALGELAPRQSVETGVEIELVRAGDEMIRVSIGADALPLDDVRNLAVEVESALRVFMVNGEPSADAYDDEAALLATALRPEGDVFSGVEVVVSDGTDFESRDLGTFHVVALLNVYRLSEPAVEQLDRFVREGGGLLVYLGDQVDPDWYNTALYRGGEGLLPAELLEIRRGATEAHLAPADRLHPVMRGLSLEGDPLGLSNVGFDAYYAVSPPGEADLAGDTPDEPADADDETGPAATVDSAARVVAVYDDAERSPAIVERTYGQAGRVVLMTSSADREWNRWPEHPTYLPIMLELVQHVARESSAASDRLVGTAIEMRVDPTAFLSDALVRTPGFPAEREVGVSAATGENGRGLLFRYEQTDVSGVYRFVLTRRDGGEVVRSVAVNVDPNESDLTIATEDELRSSLRGVPLEVIRGDESLGDGSGEARKEMWRKVLAMLFIVLMAEHGLAWWWGRKR